ncbi:MAG: peptidase M28 [Flavobacteriaceae bacterium]|nr:peptidase M28 [Flavobacteriaceae bacterium]|tara:strand:+ start:36858 stop:37868 length:1011 start_codon:yes stop_codon:yes gene_type:complete
MKITFLIAIALATVSCNTAQTTAKTKKSNTDYANSITAEELKTHLYTFASDEMQGRMTGTEGQKMAAEYLKDFYTSQGINAPEKEADYFQEIPASYFSRSRNNNPSENVVAFIKGSEKPEEVIVLSAHYDHVGVDENGAVYNGADDDGSGTVSMLEMAEAFQQAVKEGNGPKRSILFLHVTGEEIGLYGSKYYTENPLYPLENTVCNLNTDMIGRIDPDKKDNPNYIYLIGSDKLSQELHDVSEQVNEQYVNLELDYTYNDENDPNRFYYRSDHYNFAKNNIPIIFYFNGVHEDYHKPTDTPDKIEYELMAKRARLIFLTAWEVANREGRITADKL